MATNKRPVSFLEFLPEVFRTDEAGMASFLRRFLKAFETLFEELEGEVEGSSDHTGGGIPDLFDPDTTPPPQFRHLPQQDSDYLNYLASWIALPLRAEKPVDFNRQFFNAAIPLYKERSTLPGMDAMLRAWLQGDLLETDPPQLFLTDLNRAHTDVDAIFQPGETALLGVNTALGEGPPFFFVVDLVTNPAVQELRNPEGLDIFQRAARFLLDAEKPAYTYYQLRIQAHTMQLASPLGAEVAGEVYAQLGETTLLWSEPWIFDSDC